MSTNFSNSRRRVLGWLKDEFFRHFLENAARLLSANVIAGILGFFSAILAARFLGPEKYGMLALTLVYGLTFSRLVTFNVWQVIIKFGSEALHQNNKCALRQLIKFSFCLDIGSAVIGTLIAIVLSGPMTALLGWNQELKHLLVLYSILILFSLNGTPIGVLRLFDRFDMLSYTAVISSVVKLIGVLFCLITKQDLFGFVLIYLITGIIGQLCQTVFALWILHMQRVSNFFKESLIGIRANFEGILSFVWATNISSTIRLISRETDELIIGGLTSPSALGLYKIAKQFSKILPMLIDPLYHAIYPELANSFTIRNEKEFRSLIKRSVLLAGSLAVIGWCAFIFIGEKIIVISVGQIYQNAYWLAVLYMLALVIAITTFPFTPSMLALGLPKESLKILVIATLIYLATLLALLNWLGIIGASLSYLIFYLIWSVLTLLNLRRRLTKSFQFVSS